LVLTEFVIPHEDSAEPKLRTDSMQKPRQAIQLSFLCPCGKRIALKSLGCCRSCYDRRYHSLRFFGGLRERVLERDRFRCRGCGRRSALVVHHRDRRSRADWLVTLCIRCHIRIHRSSGLRFWFSAMLTKLWCELHPNDPVQLRLAFLQAEKKENSKGVLEEMSVKVLPLWVCQMPESIGALGNPVNRERVRISRVIRGREV
jgi:hypothetical protein